MLFGDLRPVSDHSYTGINVEQALSGFPDLRVEFPRAFNALCMAQPRPEPIFPELESPYTTVYPTESTAPHTNN